MQLLRFAPQTSGEVLFQFILREFYGADSLETIQALPVLGIGGRGEAFAEYFLGASALNMLARCVKKAERVRDSVVDESLRHPAMVAYFQQSLGIARQGDERLDRLVGLSLQAASDSKRPIKDAVKRLISGGSQELPCYICGAMSPRRSSDPEVPAVEFEHLWPSSFGGNSIVDNLLPSCSHCNRHKGSMLLWQTGHVFSFVLKPSPSADEITTIQRREKIALHMRNILSHACDEGISLKKAALSIGPVRLNSVYAVDSDDAMDFFNFELR